MTNPPRHKMQQVFGQLTAIAPPPGPPPEIVSLEPEVILQQLATEMIRLVKETESVKFRKTSEYTIQFGSGESITVRLKS